MGKTGGTSGKNPRVMAQAKDAIQKITGAAEVQFRHDLPQQEKISHALQTLLKVDVSEGAPLSRLRTALNLIVIAWNISVQAPEKHAQLLRDIVKQIAEPDAISQRQALNDMEELLIRKQIFFPDDKRLVVSWEVKFNGTKVLVSAAALMPPSDAPSMQPS